MGKFEEVYAINVNEKTEKKGNLTYLSWAFAWAEFKKVYPKATYSIDQFNGTFCTGNDKLGYMVHTQVTADDLTYEMWLPVMDMRNNTILQPKMTEVNKTIMRCLTKNLAMFGLGLYIYAGEDIPNEDNDNDGADKQTPPQLKQPQNGAKTPPKSNETPKAFQPITREEIMRKWGVKQVEETIAWFERKFACKMQEWDEELTDMAREFLAQKKAKREEDEKRKNTLSQIDCEELPFPVTGD